MGLLTMPRFFAKVENSNFLSLSPHHLPETAVMIIINVTEESNRDGSQPFRWIADRADPSLQWSIFSTLQHPLANAITKPRLARYLTVFDAVREAKKCDADLIVTHGTLMAVWVGIAKRLLGCHTRHLAWSFTMPLYDQQSALRNALIRFGVRDVDRFTMYSMIEAKEYPVYLNLPADRFRMIPWSVNPPTVDISAAALVEGDYVAAIGGEGRDYATLMQAAARLPEVTFAIVCTPKNLEGIEVPANVRVFTNIPYAQAMNIAYHSRVMVLPLMSGKIPCGHGSLITQYLLKKPSIVTASLAMEGYSFEGKTNLTHKPQSVDDLVAALQTLRSNPEQAAKMGEAAYQFALTQCAEAQVIEYFHNYLQEVVGHS